MTFNRKVLFDKQGQNKWQRYDSEDDNEGGHDLIGFGTLI
jgi:hypothetical protein